MGSRRAKGWLLALTILAAGTGLLLTESLAGEAAQSRPATGPAILADFPMEPGSLIVPVRFQGKEYSFELDTGCTRSVFDPSFKEKLGSPMSKGQSLSPAGVQKTEFYYAPDAFLGKIDLTYGGKVECEDLKFISRSSGVELRGILGVTAVRPYVLQLDYDAERIRVFESDKKDHADWGEAISMTFSEGDTPIVPITVGKYSGYAILDTGINGFVCIPVDAFNESVREHEIKKMDSPAEVFGGTVTGSMARFGTMSVGKFSYKDVIVHGMNFPLGCLGSNFFCRHIVTMDFPNLKMYLKKSKYFAEPHEINMAGFRPVRDGNNVSVGLLPGAEPARNVGIRDGDVLLKVDGKDATKMRFYDIGEILQSGDGKVIPVTVRRDGQVLEFTVTLKREI